MTIQRYTDGRAYSGNVGIPAVTEHPEGEYMLYADHVRILAACELHNELLIARLKRAEGEEG